VNSDAVSGNAGDCAENAREYPSEAREDLEEDAEGDDWSDRESQEEESEEEKLMCYDMPPQDAPLFSLQVNAYT
jgi:hypothetical protein